MCSILFILCCFHSVYFSCCYYYYDLNYYPGQEAYYEYDEEGNETQFFFQILFPLIFGHHIISWTFTPVNGTAFVYSFLTFKRHLRPSSCLFTTLLGFPTSFDMVETEPSNQKSVFSSEAPTRSSTTRPAQLLR